MHILDEIESKKKEAKDDRDLKLMLAQEIVSMYYSEKEATEAQEKWIAIFSEGEIPKDIPVCEVSENTSLVEALTLSEHASSKSEARRLIEQGGVVDTATEEKITDPKYSIESTVTLRIKKHSFITYQSV